MISVTGEVRASVISVVQPNSSAPQREAFDPAPCQSLLIGCYDPLNPLYNSAYSSAERLSLGEAYLRDVATVCAASLQKANNPDQRVQLLTILKKYLTALNKLKLLTPAEIAHNDQLRNNIEMLHASRTRTPIAVINPDREIAACEQLGGSTESPALSELALTLRDNPHYAVKAAAAVALTRSHNAYTVLLLSSLPPKADCPVLKCLFEIALFPDQMERLTIEICNLTDGNSFREAAVALSLRSEPYVVERLQHLSRCNRGQGVFDGALSALARIATAHAEASLIQAVVDGLTFDDRPDYLDILLKNRRGLHHDNLKLVIDYINSSSPKAAAAIEIAQVSNDQEIQNAVFEALFHPDSAQIRAAAAKTLCIMELKLSYLQRERLLKDGLRSDSGHTQGAAQDLLAKDGSERSVRALLEVTFGPSKSTLGALPALQRLRETEHGFETLVSLAGSKFTRLYSRIARGAAKILGQVEGEALRKRALELGFAKASRKGSS